MALFFATTLPSLPCEDPAGYRVVLADDLRTEDDKNDPACDKCALNTTGDLDMQKTYLCQTSPCLPEMRADGRRVYYLAAA